MSHDPDDPKQPAGRSVSRRGFLAASGAMASGAMMAGMAPAAGAASAGEGARGAAGARMEIAEILPPPAGRLWRLVKQCGVDFAVGTWGGRPPADAVREARPWSYDSMARLKELYEREGFRVPVLEWRPPMNRVKLGLAGEEEEIEAVCELLRAMGRLKIPVWCYEWMPVFNWMRTETARPSRGGALVTAFDLARVEGPPVTEHGEVTEERLWACLKRFLERVLPVAEEAGVKLAMHPDDPPLSPLRGMGRIMRSIENFQRLVDLVPSPANGITFCQGNFTLMTEDLPAAIRRFGEQKKIFFVHFRDVRGAPEKFEETFHDDGKTDMAACMRAYRDIGFDGICRPDHVPTLDGDDNDRPGYSTLGRLFAVGYIRGLQQAVYREGRTGRTG